VAAAPISKALLIHLTMLLHGPRNLCDVLSRIVVLENSRPLHFPQGSGLGIPQLLDPLPFLGRQSQTSALGLSSLGTINHSKLDMFY
jgi:hypothetical protein